MTPLYLLPDKAATTKSLSEPATCIVVANTAILPVNILFKEAQYTLLLVIHLITPPFHQKVPLGVTGHIFPPTKVVL